MHGWYGLDGSPQPETFKVLEYPYSTDGIQVFYRDSPINGANPDDFTILFPENSHNWYEPAYAISDGVVYYESFTMKEEIYDKNFEPQPIEPVDIESFEMVDVPDLPFSYLSNSVDCDWHDTVYAKDKNTIYAGYYPLDYLDPDTFEIIDCRYAKDKSGVYKAYDLPFIESIPWPSGGIWDVYYWRYVDRLEDIDSENFKRVELPQIQGHSYTDLDYVYHRGALLESFDLNPYTAKLLEKGVIEDGDGNRCEFKYNRF